MNSSVREHPQDHRRVAALVLASVQMTIRELLDDNADDLGVAGVEVDPRAFREVVDGRGGLKVVLTHGAARDRQTEYGGDCSAEHNRVLSTSRRIALQPDDRCAGYAGSGRAGRR